MTRAVRPDPDRFIPARAGNTHPPAGEVLGVTVHPRSRGEHTTWSLRSKSPPGSSPLARGTRQMDGLTGAVARFIPARAGNTADGRIDRGGSPVHPRSRGEHAVAQQHAGDKTGSSPLARGTLPRLDDVEHVRRFIPARAGNTHTLRPAAATRPVHPRSRGEHGGRHQAVPSTPGSSPLARGTPSGRRRPERRRRFIPARAGNTVPRQDSPIISPVHPRSRGEHLPRDRDYHLAAGSSPLARGTPGRDPLRAVRGRFIPARAGNTNACTWATSRGPVHPRSRGEHCPTSPVGSSPNGSSPLARGTRRRRVRPRPPHRFIPARAGNTTRRAAPNRYRAVHPRSRGEHRRTVSTHVSTIGSSPLARGTREPAGDVPDVPRFIPARAGNTS